MRTIWVDIIRIILGFGAGLVISGGVVAFISIIGIVPLMANRTKTRRHVKCYETMIMIGAVFGSILSVWEPYIPIGKVFTIIISFAFGMFVGTLIIALAEVLDVFPIIGRRIKLKKGISLCVWALAAGKLVGSLYYWLYPIFIEII